MRIITDVVKLPDSVPVRQPKIARSSDFFKYSRRSLSGILDISNFRCLELFHSLSSILKVRDVEC